MERKLITFGDLKIFIKELDGMVYDDSPILIPGYEDGGYDHIVSVCKKSVSEYHLDHEKDSYSPRYARNPIPRLKTIEAIVLKSDKYLMRNNDASE